LRDGVLVEQEWSAGMKKAVEQIEEWRGSGWNGVGVAIATRGEPGRKADGRGGIERFLLRFGTDGAGRVVAGLESNVKELEFVRSAPRALPNFAKEARSQGPTKKRPAGSVEATATVTYEPGRDGRFCALPMLRFRLNVGRSGSRAGAWERFIKTPGRDHLTLLDGPFHRGRTLDLDRWAPERVKGKGPDKSKGRARAYARWRLEGTPVPVELDRADESIVQAAQQLHSLIDRALGEGLRLEGSKLEKEARNYDSALGDLKTQLVAAHGDLDEERQATAAYDMAAVGG
jgi:hypothetical protein